MRFQSLVFLHYITINHLKNILKFNSISKFPCVASQVRKRRGRMVTGGVGCRGVALVRSLAFPNWNPRFVMQSLDVRTCAQLAKTSPSSIWHDSDWENTSRTSTIGMKFRIAHCTGWVSPIGAQATPTATHHQKNLY